MGGWGKGRGRVGSGGRKNDKKKFFCFKMASNIVTQKYWKAIKKKCNVFKKIIKKKNTKAAI